MVVSGIEKDYNITFQCITSEGYCKDSDTVEITILHCDDQDYDNSRESFEFPTREDGRTSIPCIQGFVGDSDEGKIHLTQGTYRVTFEEIVNGQKTGNSFYKNLCKKKILVSKTEPS